MTRRINRGQMERSVRIADRLYAARRTIRSLWGDGWRERLQPYMEALQEVAVTRDQVLPTTLGMCEAMPPGDPAMLPTLAAAVELLEPLEQPNRRHAGRADLGRRAT